MSVSLDEFRDRVRVSPQGVARIAELRALAQEPVRMTAVTGSAEWDYFLRYLEAHIKAAQRQIKVKTDQAAALVLVDEKKAKEAAVMVAALVSRAQTLEEVLLLPKWIKESGEQAAKTIAELEASV